MSREQIFIVLQKDQFHFVVAGRYHCDWELFQRWHVIINSEDFLLTRRKSFAFHNLTIENHLPPE